MRIFVFILTCFVVQLWSHSFGSWCGEGNRRYITDSGLIQPILTWEIAAPSCQTLIYADEKLIEQRESLVVARHLENGDSLWAFDVGEPCYYPATNGEVVIVPTKRKYYYCLDVETGSLLWSDSTTSTIATHALTYGNKILLGDEQGEFHRIEGNNEIDVTVTLKDVILGSTPCFLNSLLIQSAKPLSCTVFEIPGGDYVFCTRELTILR